jgi:hypothetical protein
MVNNGFLHLEEKASKTTFDCIYIYIISSKLPSDLEEEFEDAKGVIRIRISKMNR